MRTQGLNMQIAVLWNMQIQRSCWSGPLGNRKHSDKNLINRVCFCRRFSVRIVALIELLQLYSRCIIFSFSCPPGCIHCWCALLADDGWFHSRVILIFNPQPPSPQIWNHGIFTCLVEQHPVTVNWYLWALFLECWPSLTGIAFHTNCNATEP